MTARQLGVSPKSTGMVRTSSMLTVQPSPPKPGDRECESPKVRDGSELGAGLAVGSCAFVAAGVGGGNGSGRRFDARHDFGCRRRSCRGSRRSVNGGWLGFSRWLAARRRCVGRRFAGCVSARHANEHQNCDPEELEIHFVWSPLSPNCCRNSLDENNSLKRQRYAPIARAPDARLAPTAVATEIVPTVVSATVLGV